MNSNQAPALSVVIINFNGGARVLACLESLSTVPCRRPFEVIVYDNASRDDTPNLIAARFPNVNLIRSHENLGYCSAFNAAVRQCARAPILLALDNDTCVLEGALDTMFDFLELRPDVGAVGSNLYNPDGSLQHGVRRFPRALSGVFSRRGILTRLFPNNPVARQDLMIDYRNAAQPFPIDWHSAASLMIRRAAYEQAGGWDEDFFVYWSDADLCARIHAAGYKIYNVPAAKIVHDESLAGRKGRLNARMVIDFHRGAYLFYLKHRLRSRANPLAPLVWLGLMARALAIIGFDRLRWKWRQLMLGQAEPGRP